MSRLKKSLFLVWLIHRKLFKYTAILLASLVILTFLLSLLLAGGLYYANEHGHLQEWLNKGIKTIHVSYEKAHVSWDYGDPTLSLSGVQIMDSATMNAPIKLDAVSLSFGIWPSILRRELVTDNLMISGLSFDVEQQQNGALQVVGFEQSNSASAISYQPSPAVTKWFLAQNHVHLDNIGLNLHLRNGKSLSLQIDEMSWSRYFGYHFAMDGTVPQIPGSSLHIDANLVPNENPFDFEGWHVSFNGSLVGQDFTPLFLQQDLYNFSWVSGGGKVDFHGVWDNNALQFLNAYINLNNVNLAHSVSKNMISPNFDEEVLWQALAGGGWEITLTPSSNIGNSTLSLLKVRYDPTATKTWQMIAENVDLRLVGQWVSFWFPSTAYTARAWQVLKPLGVVTSLNATAGNGSGELTVQGKNLTISNNPMFPEGWPATDLNLNVNWTKGTSASILENISLITLNLSNAWINLSLAGSASVPAKNPMNPTINLQGTFSGQNLEQVKAFYVPQKFVAKGLTGWLLQGLLKLPKATGALTLRGALADFPYANGKGLFQIALHVVGGSISPWPEWPVISGITADVLFKNQKLTIDSNQAETMNTPLQNVHFEIADLRPHLIKEIVITGKAKPSGENALRYLMAMPLTDPKLGEWLSSLDLSGYLPLTMQIVIPLEEHEPIVASGDVSFEQNDWALEQNEKPLITNIEGGFHFVNNEISSDHLNFNALGQTLNVTVPQSPLTHLHLFFQQFEFLGQNFPNLEMDVVSQNDKTFLSFIHPLVNGILSLTAENQAINAHFSEFHLALMKTAASDSDAPVLLGSLLSHVPALNIIVDDLYYGPIDLGHLSLNSVPISQGIQINHLNVTGKDLTLTTTAKIQTLEQLDHFTFGGTLGSQNYGNLLTDLDYPGLMNGGSGEIHFNLNWAGQILKPDWTTMNGTLDFGLADGKFLKINAGLTRIFGLVSLDTIFSTLSLNFEKMLSNGLSFDALAGTYTIQNGTATTNKDGIRLTGPSLSLILKGQMNLVSQTLQQTATVMPQVGTSIAIAAAFVGGPIAGVATWFADKLLGNTLFKNTGLTYNVTGPFDKPIVSLSSPAAS